MQLMRRSEVLDRLLGKNDVTVEQDDTRFEVLLGFELRIGRRIKRFDEGDMFDSDKSFFRW